MSNLCYGCGRCIPICPISNIEAHFHQADIRSLSEAQHLDAIEIHTHIGQQVAFAQLWESLVAMRSKLKLVSVSCPGGPGLESYLKDLSRYHGSPLHTLDLADGWSAHERRFKEKGLTHAAIRLAQRVFATGLTRFRSN